MECSPLILQYATIFSNFGQTEVHLVNQRKPRLLPGEDMDVSELVSKNLLSAGVKVYNNCDLDKITRHGSTASVHLSWKNGAGGLR